MAKYAAMKNLLFVLLLLIAPSLAAAEKPVAEQIVDKELASSKAWEILEYLSDNIGPRLSGSRQADAAVHWTAEKLKSWGLDVVQQPLMVPKWVRGAEEARLVSHLDQKIVLTALGGSVATPPEGITGEVIVVGSLAEVDTLGEKHRGKMVLYNNPMDSKLVESGRAFEAYGGAVGPRVQGASRAAEYGAVASLIRSVTTRSLRTPHTGSLRYDEKFPQIPAAAMTTEDADLIGRLVAKGEKVLLHLKLTPQTLPDVPSANVIAEIVGREKPDEIVLIGAHLDSWDLGTAAIDDGAGVAMVMETMRILKEMKLTPRRTIRAVLFMNEENGLRGGRGYAESQKNNLMNHVAAIESDAGGAAPLGFITTLSPEGIAALKKELTPLGRIKATMLNYSEQTGADTSPLTREGVVGFGLVPEPLHYFDYHHTPADTLDKVDPKELSQNSAAMAVLAWTLAEREGRLK